jgi:hypothetical protein
MKRNFPNPVGDDARSLAFPSDPSLVTSAPTGPKPRHLGSCETSLQPSQQRGVALIITLILLGVVTFMAVAFLALSRRERGAVTTVTDTAGARLAADAALAKAEAQVMANVLSTTNPYSFGLLVSTNFINPVGFDNANLTPFWNINYDYQTNGFPLSQNQFLTLLTNLWYSPRPPVFIVTNQQTGGSDFRYYLDLNRNGRYDTNGLVENFDNNTNDLHTQSIQVGDPEWIGILQRPDQPHGPNNPFVARYAFIAVPVGNTLDLNAIYNDATQPDPTMAPGHDGFLRNQGVGSWEINLAAFLTDLNTNQWDPPTPWNTANDPYVYDTWNGTLYNSGAGFEDALSLLKYRYYQSYNNLAGVQYLYPFAQSAFTNNIDAYSDNWRRLMTSPAGINVSGQNLALPWSGADNTNHFFTHQELFDPNKTALEILVTNNFPDHLLTAGNSVSTYDRYTFYRLLSQLGTDSTPESGRMNLNYQNLDINGNVVAGMETNFIPWTNALAFFTNAADRLLRAYTTRWRYGNPTNFATTFYAATNFNFINADQWSNYPAFGLGRIPVLVSNQFVYSSAVNRLLQLAANLYDATTNSFYPSVFRPTFWVTNEFGNVNVYINGYQQVIQVSGANDSQLTPLQWPGDVTTLASGVQGSTAVKYPFGVNVYGVPWIIGAKKGFPNFNKFTLQDVVQTTRKLQIFKKAGVLGPTNQMYIFSISNSIGMDLWNSYSNWYPNPFQIVANDNLYMGLTYDFPSPGQYYGPSNYPANANLPYLSSSSWAGSAWTTRNLTNANQNSFIIPIAANFQFMLTNAFYFGSSPPGVVGFYPPNNNLSWETNNHSLVLTNNFILLMTNRLQVFILDGGGPPYHVIDYAQFAGPNSSRNLTAEFQTNYGNAAYLTTPYDGIWNTNLDSYFTPWGIRNQIDISLPKTAVNTAYWTDPSASDEQNGFSQFMGYTTYNNGSSTAQSYATNNPAQVPYTPTVTAYEYISWQANDPLVHYLASDLTFQGTENNGSGPRTGITVTSTKGAIPRPLFNKVNDRYQPWSMLHINNLSPAQYDINPWNLTYMDPLVRISDNWDFPANKLPTVGWLGRVHRGTPWQTIYLKASDVLKEVQSSGPNNYLVGTNTWVQWTGNSQLTYGQYFDAANTAPVQDRLLFDLFTTAVNDNATRGTLSVNQDHLAAWSAVFSGVVALSNNLDNIQAVNAVQFQNPPPSYSGTNIIQPAGPAWTNSPLYQLVNGINQTRATFRNADGLAGTFEHLGDILSVPQFTEQSPFLDVANIAQLQKGISDEMYEWLPQQTMSLLRGGGSPRYVIYCYGQALKPAPNSIQNSGPFFGMITNYQVVSEIATRAVVRFNSTVTNVITFTNDAFNNIYWYSVPVVTNNNAVIENFNILPPD